MQRKYKTINAIKLKIGLYLQENFPPTSLDMKNQVLLEKLHHHVSQIMDTQNSYDFDLTTEDPEAARKLKECLVAAYGEIESSAKAEKMKEFLDKISKDEFDQSVSELVIDLENYPGEDIIDEFEKLDVSPQPQHRKLDVGEERYMKLIEIIKELDDFRMDNPTRFAKPEVLEKRKDQKWSANAGHLNNLIKELETLKLSFTSWQALNITMKNKELAKKVIALLGSYYNKAQGASQSSIFLKGKKSGFKEELLRLAQKACEPYLSSQKTYDRMNDLVRDAKSNVEEIEDAELKQKGGKYTK